MVDWARLTGKASATQFADAIDAALRIDQGFEGKTAIGDALHFAMDSLAGNAYEGVRRKVDVSGDGHANEGFRPGPVRDYVVLSGVTVNGLAIINDEPYLEDYYRRNVIGGPGAFVMVAADYGGLHRSDPSQAAAGTDAGADRSGAGVDGRRLTAPLQAACGHLPLALARTIYRPTAAPKTKMWEAPMWPGSRRALVAFAVVMMAAAAQAADLGTMKVGVLKFGTVNWELDVIKAHELDRKEGFTLDVQAFGGNEAADVALMGGAVDAIVEDWLLVSRQRADGVKLSFIPYSSNVGAVMVKPDSPIAGLADLKGKKLGIAGGPLDKGWLMLQGYAKQQAGMDLTVDVEPVYGAPPLLTEKLKSGELDAVLNYWHFGARLEAAGYRQLIGIGEVQEALGVPASVPQLGYIFHESWADRACRSRSGIRPRVTRREGDHARQRCRVAAADAGDAGRERGRACCLHAPLPRGDCRALGA